MVVCRTSSVPDCFGFPSGFNKVYLSVCPCLTTDYILKPHPAHTQPRLFSPIFFNLQTACLSSLFQPFNIVSKHFVMLPTALFARPLFLIVITFLFPVTFVPLSGIIITYSILFSSGPSIVRLVYFSTSQAVVVLLAASPSSSFII